MIGSIVIVLIAAFSVFPNSLSAPGGIDQCPSDGSFAILPNSNNHQQFYYCMKGEAVLMTCPEGLSFDVEKSSCNLPIAKGDEENDGDDDADEDSSSSSSSSSSEEIECPAVDGALPTFIPNSDDCSKYSICSNGEAISMNCPGGLEFNPQSNVCDWADQAGCATDDSSSSSSEEDESGEEEEELKKL